MCTQDLDEHELGEHGLCELRARDWHLGIPSPALRCAGKKAVRARTGKKGATGSRHLAFRCLNPVRRAGIFMISPSLPLNGRSTARDRAKPSTALEGLDGVGISTEQRPETSLPGLVSAAKGSAKTRTNHSGVQVMMETPQWTNAR